MAESEEAQQVPVCQKYPRVQQDGEAGKTHSAEANSAAIQHLKRDLQIFAGLDCPGRPAGTHRSDSAGAWSQREPDDIRPACSNAAVQDRSTRHEMFDGSVHRSEAAELSRCGTPEQGMQAIDGLLSSLTQGYAVPFPDSSTIGMSPRQEKAPMQAAESSRSDDSNANPGNFLGTESPPWSPRRVPPAHLWGEGPPRYPGYRSGGATLPDALEGATAADLLEAACELQTLLTQRASFGLGPLLHAQPYFSADSAPGDRRLSGHCMTSQGPSTPILQAVPMQDPPAHPRWHTGLDATPGTLCAEGALLSPVPMQLPAGGSFPTPCMWDLTKVHVREPVLAAGIGPCTDEVDPTHEALFRHQTGSATAIPTTTAESMGISPVMPCKSSLQPKQAHGLEGGPSTPANAEKDKTNGSKRCADDAATSEQAAGAPRKPRRATKRRLF